MVSVDTMLELPPVTHAMAFIRAPLDVVRASMLAWQAEYGRASASTELKEPVPSILARLAPFAWTPDTELLVATDGEWTAYFNNASYGTDTGSISHLALRLGCEVLTLRMCDEPAARYLNVMEFTLSGPEQTHWLNTVRHVGWLGERPAFNQHGAPLPFERTELYQARKVKDRLPKAVLLEYAAAMGIRPLDESYYRPHGYLLTGPRPPETRTWTFEEWREKHLARGRGATRGSDAALRGPPAYLRKKVRKAEKAGPAKLLADGAWCGHGEPRFWVYDVRAEDQDVFALTLPAPGDDAPPVVRAAAGATSFALYDSRRHPASVFVGRKDEAAGKPLVCGTCGGGVFRAAVGFEVPADAASALDTSWFALAVTCVACGWSAIAWEDETA